MKNAIFLFVAVSLLGMGNLAFSATETPGADKPVDWADPVTGWHYMFLPTKRNFSHAAAACGNRGWSLFNLQYLSAEEQERFHASPIYQALPWMTKFAGEPGEIKEAGYWTSSESDSGAIGVRMKSMKIEMKVRISYDMMDARTAENAASLSVICMYRGKTWFNCGITQKCDLLGYTNSSGQPMYEFPYGSVTTNFSESAVTKEAALALLLKHTDYMQPGDKVHKKCAADKESFTCSQEH